MLKMNFANITEAQRFIQRREYENGERFVTVKSQKNFGESGVPGVRCTSFPVGRCVGAPPLNPPQSQREHGEEARVGQQQSTEFQTRHNTSAQFKNGPAQHPVVTALQTSDARNGTEDIVISLTQSASIRSKRLEENINHLRNQNAPEKEIQGLLRQKCLVDRRQNANGIVLEKFGMRVTNEHLVSFEPGLWLCTQAMMFYLKLLEVNNGKVCIVKATFMPHTDKPTIDGIKDCLRSASLGVITLILIPVFTDIHASLAVIDLRHKTMTYLDSDMNVDEDMAKKILKDIWDVMWNACHSEGVEGMLNALRFIVKRDIPWQTNNYDCGVFMLAFARKIADGEPIRFIQVNEHYSLSPGKYTHDRFTGLEKKRQRRRLEQETAQYKIRRLHLKEEKRQGQEFHANLEGTTYGVDPLTPPEPDNLVDIPEPVLNPGPPSIGTGNNAIVVFDLETTGFGMGSDIIQIAAKEIRTGNLFSRYVYPASGVIPNNIAKLTGIMFCNQQMTHHGKPVPGCTATEACEAFIRFIEQFSPVVLVAHNVLFDSKILLNSFHRCSIDYHSIINGFGDTLKLFRNELPERKQNGLGYKQADLVNDILSRKYNAHSADEDVSTLCDLLETVQNYGHKLPFHSKKSIESRVARINNLMVNLPTYDTVTKPGVLSVAKGKSLSSAGISLSHLRVICQRSGVDGLVLILKHVVSSPRTVASSLYNFFTNT